MIAEAKVMQVQGLDNAQLTDLRKQLAKAQYKVSMGEAKINAILKRPKNQHFETSIWIIGQRVEDIVNTSSGTAAIKGRRDNPKTQPQEYFKMTKEAISTVQAEIARDLCDMAATHSEEISQIMQEFDKHEIDTSM